MGFFDRFTQKKPNAAPVTPPAPPSEASVSTPPVEHAAAPAASPVAIEPPAAAPTPGTASPFSVQPLLASAREKLEARDLAGAVAIYEELLRTAGDRPDVLVALSGDLGSCGYVEQIVELVAPRYDADRHGPATGLNLLQAYLATRNTGAAQHLLDILFALDRPELEERLYGFSNALAELIEAERRGQLAPAMPSPAEGSAPPPPGTRGVISLASISKPIWWYGLDTVPNLLPPKDGKLRRIAFAQLANLGLADLGEKMTQPEEELGRFSRGFALWLAETFWYSPHYSPIAAVGLAGKEHFALFGSEWTTEHLRQLVSTVDGGLDYVFTGALQHESGDYELIVRVWEIKKFRERKTFSVRWTPATADAELAKLHEQIRQFMEWSAYPAGTGLTYTPATRPLDWIHTLGSSAGFFLADKATLPVAQVAAPAEALARAAAIAGTGETASLAWLTLADRARRLGLGDPSTHAPTLLSTPAVEQAQHALDGTGR